MLYLRDVDPWQRTVCYVYIQKGAIKFCAALIIPMARQSKEKDRKKLTQNTTPVQKRWASGQLRGSPQSPWINGHAAGLGFKQPRKWMGRREHWNSSLWNLNGYLGWWLFHNTCIPHWIEVSFWWWWNAWTYGYISLFLSYSFRPWLLIKCIYWFEPLVFSMDHEPASPNRPIQWKSVYQFPNHG